MNQTICFGLPQKHWLVISTGLGQHRKPATTQRFQGKKTCPIPKLGSKAAYNKFFEDRYDRFKEAVLTGKATPEETATILALLEFGEPGLAKLAYRDYLKGNLKGEDLDRFNQALSERAQAPHAYYPTALPSPSVYFEPLNRELLGQWIKAQEKGSLQIQEVKMCSGKVATLSDDKQDAQVLFTRGLAGCFATLFRTVKADGKLGAFITHYPMGAMGLNFSKLREMVKQLSPASDQKKNQMTVCSMDIRKRRPGQSRQCDDQLFGIALLEKVMGKLLKHPIKAEVSVYPELMDPGPSPLVNVHQAAAVVLTPTTQGGTGRLLTSWGDEVSFQAEPDSEPRVKETA